MSARAQLGSAKHGHSGELDLHGAGDRLRRRRGQDLGRLSADTRRAGRPRPVNDMWNAACCLVEGLPLATLNMKDYQDFVDHHGLVVLGVG